MRPGKVLGVFVFVFSCKVTLINFLLVDLHNSVPALTFTAAFLHSKHRKKIQMQF